MIHCNATAHAAENITLPIGLAINTTVTSQSSTTQHHYNRTSQWETTKSLQDVNIVQTLQVRGLGRSSTPGQGFCRYGQNLCPSLGQAGVEPLQHAPC